MWSFFCWQMMEHGKADFLDYNIYLTRGWDQNEVSWNRYYSLCCTLQIFVWTVRFGDNSSLFNGVLCRQCLAEVYDYVSFLSIRPKTLCFTKTMMLMPSPGCNKRLTTADPSGRVFSTIWLPLTVGKRPVDTMTPRFQEGIWLVIQFYFGAYNFW